MSRGRKGIGVGTGTRDKYNQEEMKEQDKVHGGDQDQEYDHNF